MSTTAASVLQASSASRAMRTGVAGTSAATFSRTGDAGSPASFVSKPEMLHQPSAHVHLSRSIFDRNVLQTACS